MCELSQVDQLNAILKCEADGKSRQIPTLLSGTSVSFVCKALAIPMQEILDVAKCKGKKSVRS